MLFSSHLSLGERATISKPQLWFQLRNVIVGSKFHLFRCFPPIVSHGVFSPEGIGSQFGP